jgi:hypothetical protein
MPVEKKVESEAIDNKRKLNREVGGFKFIYKNTQ